MATLNAEGPDPTGSPLGIAVEQVSGCAVMTLSGELDIVAVGAFRSELLSLITDGATRIVVDLTSVDLMDSAGVGALVLAHKRSRVLRCRFAVVCADGPVRRVLSLTGLLHVLQVFETRETAISGTGGENPPTASS